MLNEQKKLNMKASSIKPHPKKTLQTTVLYSIPNLNIKYQMSSSIPNDFNSVIFIKVPQLRRRQLCRPWVIIPSLFRECQLLEPLDSIPWMFKSSMQMKLKRKVMVKNFDNRYRGIERSEMIVQGIRTMKIKQLWKMHLITIHLDEEGRERH